MIEQQNNTENDLAFVQSFREGQAVPEWLLAMEPTSAVAIRGSLTFATDVRLFEDRGGYWLLPTDPTKMVHMIRLSGGRDCKLMAGSQRLSYPAQIVTAHVDGTGQDVKLR